MNLRTLFESYSDQIAISYDGKRITFADLLNYADLNSSNSIQFVFYDRSLRALIDIITCFISEQPCFILNDTWPPNYKESLMDHLNDFEIVGPVILMPTSGTTSMPKLCVIDQQKIYISVLRSLSLSPISSDEYFLLSLQPFHMGGLLSIFKSLISGGTLLASANHWSKLLFERKKMHLAIVPTQFNHIKEFVESAYFSKDSFVSILISGDFISDDIRNFAQNFDLPIIISYGMTETCGQIISTKLGDSVSNIHSGIALEGVKVMITDDFQLCVHTTTLANGYIQNGQEFSLPILDKYWFRTGDLAKIDSKNQVSIIGRMDFQFKSGGELVSPEVIESIMMQSNLVRQIRVVARTDSKYGSVPIAFVDTDYDFQLLRDYSHEHLPRYLQPVAWYSI